MRCPVCKGEIVFGPVTAHLHAAGATSDLCYVAWRCLDCGSGDPAVAIAPGGSSGPFPDRFEPATSGPTDPVVLRPLPTRPGLAGLGAHPTPKALPRPRRKRRKPRWKKRARGRR